MVGKMSESRMRIDDTIGASARDGEESPSRPRPLRDRGPRLHETTVELEVPFYEVDPMGIVWHGHYLRYFDVARTALLRGLGLDAGRSLGGNFVYMVSESRCRHVAPLRYGDRFRVTAWLRDVERRINVQFEIWNLSDDRLSARGHTHLVCVDEHGKMLLETPPSILKRLKP